MCMEDICLGRKVATTEYYFQLGVVSTQLLGNNPNRVFIKIYSKPSFAAVSECTFTTQPPAVADNGFMTSGYNHPVELDVKTHGNIVMKAWFGISSAGTIPVMIVEGTLNDDCVEE